MNNNAMTGHLLTEELKERGITLQAFEDKTGMDVMGLVQGKKVLTGRDASILSVEFGTSMTLWLNLDDAYRRNYDN